MPTAKRSSAQAHAEKEIMTRLDELGGTHVRDDSLVWEGTRIVLPEAMQPNVQQVVKFLQEWDEQQNTDTAFTKVFRYRPADGAAAFERAMVKVFGTTGIGGGLWSLPEYRSVPAGPHGEDIQVPQGIVELPLLHATFLLGSVEVAGAGEVFAIKVKTLRQHRKRIEGFFKMVERELREHSLYKGHAITAAPGQPEFLDAETFDESKVIYKADVYTQLQVNLWSPMQHSAALRKAGIPLKRAVLLEGPNGTGKTLAGLWTAKIAVQNGWTFILVRAGDDPFRALETAKIYAPAVVWVEDLEQLAAASKADGEVTRLLDVLDNVQGKGAEVMAGFTTNFAETLVRDVVRPGRLDAVIRVAELDADGYGRLIRALIPGTLLEKDLDYVQAAAAYAGMLPAFAVEAIQRAVRYSIARNDGAPGMISAADLADAAAGMRDHLDLMAKAMARTQEPAALETALAATVEAAAQTAAVNALTGLLDQRVIRLVDPYGDERGTLRRRKAA